MYDMNFEGRMIAKKTVSAVFKAKTNVSEFERVLFRLVQHKQYNAVMFIMLPIRDNGILNDIIKILTKIIFFKFDHVLSTCLCPTKSTDDNAFFYLKNIKYSYNLFMNFVFCVLLIVTKS